MQYIYHTVPSHFCGTRLFPLNTMGVRNPDIYTHEMAKYQDSPARRQLPATSIPILDCLWNDVIHCAPIHPHLLFREWTRFRSTPPREQNFFRIPVGHIARLPGVIMYPGKDGNRRYTSFDPALYRELMQVPPETSSLYEQLAAQGRFGALFVGIPHILIQGTIETNGLPIIPWSLPITE